MKLIENQSFDEERALYGERELIVNNCSFDGIKDGESAFKECNNIEVNNSFFNLRYPFWHDNNIAINSSTLTENARAAIWYSKDIKANNCKFHGIKAFRECSNISIKDSDIISLEFGWSSNNMIMDNTNVQSEYFMMRSDKLSFSNVNMKGKYSFQYIKDSTFDNCTFDTKDAFWHGENITIKNSTIKGEYLAWYSKGLTFINCKIIGTQPFCYCEDLKLIDCEMINADLAFEKSEVEATITTSVDSIKNPLSGKIVVASVKEIIMDDINAKGEIIIR